MESSFFQSIPWNHLTNWCNRVRIVFACNSKTRRGQRPPHRVPSSPQTPSRMCRMCPLVHGHPPSQRLSLPPPVLQGASWCRPSTWMLKWSPSAGSRSLRGGTRSVCGRWPSTPPAGIRLGSAGGGGNIVFSKHYNIKGEVFRYLVDLEPGNIITLFDDGRPYTYTVG
jgi:hypothetical protein